jgi:hypothetical protein
MIKVIVCEVRFLKIFQDLCRSTWGLISGILQQVFKWFWSYYIVGKMLEKCCAKYKVVDVLKWLIMHACWKFFMMSWTEIMCQFCHDTICIFAVSVRHVLWYPDLEPLQAFRSFRMFMHGFNLIYEF